MPPLGAQVDGLGLRQAPDEAVKSSLRQALLDHLVLVVRDQALDDDTQYRFASCFGHPAQVKSGASRDDASRHVLLVANVTDLGACSALGDGAMDFHTDQCDCETPVKATTLHALKVLVTGGDTVFINGYLAYDALPESPKPQILGLNAVMPAILNAT
jgi:taurine dioxygenase